MRERKEIEQSTKSYEALCLEVLLDIRDILNPNKLKEPDKVVKEITPKPKRRKKRKYVRRKPLVK